jgi:hypothetical protein
MGSYQLDSLERVDDFVDAGARQHIDAIPLDDSHHLFLPR